MMTLKLGFESVEMGKDSIQGRKKKKEKKKKLKKKKKKKQKTTNMLKHRE